MDNLKQEILWYLDKHSIVDLYKITDEAISERAELENKPILKFNYLNQDKITKDDPLLNLVLTKKIPDGCQRNSILFKNLAPILVALDLHNNEEILNKIISNCPNKNISELKGWLWKAMRGELNLNKIEINRWCEKYGERII